MKLDVDPSDRRRGPISREQALKEGVSRYYTGIPCIRGHTTERWTASSACVQCAKELTFGKTNGHTVKGAKLSERIKEDRQLNKELDYLSNIDL